MKILNKKAIYVIVAIILIAGIVYWIRAKNQDTEIILSNTIEVPKQEKEKIIVDVEGSINLPGVIELEEGSRILDAIEKAGGLTEEANTKNINLAYKVGDGEKIYIPSIYDNEEVSTITEEAGENIIKGNKTKKVNINTATQKELETLPSVGEATALNIIKYRKENGKFKKPEDIKNVSGIGDAKYEKMKDYITTN